jgi:hypothetical protein
MRRSTGRRLSRITLGHVALALACAALPAQAEAHVITRGEYRCIEAVARNAGRFLLHALQAEQRCRLRNLETPGACDPSDLASRLAKHERRVRVAIRARCTPADVVALDYLAPCADSGGAFVLDALADCMVEAHEAAAEALLDVDVPSAPGPLAPPLQRCQATVANTAAHFTKKALQAYQRCRGRSLEGRTTGVSPIDCASDARTRERVEVARGSARSRIERACDAEALGLLDACPPSGPPPDPIDCLLDAHEDTLDHLLGYQYPVQ